MSTRVSVDSTAIGTMVLVCAVLGVQQVALKSVASDMSPVLQLGVRSGIAALLVTLLMRYQGVSFRFNDKTLMPGLSLGVLFTLEYLFLGEALRYGSASRAVVFLYSAPVFAAVILHVLMPEERLTRIQWVGILMAFAGMALAFAVKSTGENSDVGNIVLADALGLLAGLAWGLSTVVVRTTTLAQIPATRTLWYQLTAAFVLLILAAVLLDQTSVTFTPALVANLAFQGVLVSFASFLVWLSLLRRYVASELGVLLFMTPVFGVLAGIFLLNEPVQASFIFGAVMLIVGILLVSARQLFVKER